MSGFWGMLNSGEIYAVLLYIKIKSKWSEDILTR
jgi:hypothetical protein